MIDNDFIDVVCRNGKQLCITSISSLQP